MDQPLLLIVQQHSLLLNGAQGRLEEGAGLGPFQPVPPLLEGAVHGPLEAGFPVCQHVPEFPLVGYRTLCSVGGSGCPEIGGKIGDGHVRLMAHGSNHRDR